MIEPWTPRMLPGEAANQAQIATVGEKATTLSCPQLSQ